MTARSGGPRLWPLYAGGFLGPFAGALPGVMLPELADGLHTTVAGASTSITWFMIPFAAFMLVSGTLGARWGEARTARVAFFVYAAASVVGAIATALTPFLAGRFLQGAANSFTTPLLLSLLVALAPADRRGRSIGIFVSMQASGTAFAPLIGGVAAAVDYRWAFAAAALAAVVLGLLVPQITVREDAPAVSGRERWRALINPRLGIAAAIAFCMQFNATSIAQLVPLIGADRFGLDAVQRGLIAALFGVAGLLTGTLSGRLADRYGLRAVGTGAMLLLGVGIAAAGVTPWLWLLIAVTFVAGVGNTGGRAVAQGLAVRSTPLNPSGAASMVLALQFFGGAFSPLVIPPYQHSPAWTCAGAGAVALFGALLAYTRVRES